MSITSMINRVKLVPGPLKIVCVINLGFGLLQLSGIVLDIVFYRGGLREYEPLTFEEK